MRTYRTLMRHGDEYTLMSPIGGELPRGLVVIERSHGEVGGLPDQDWSLRVTWVVRRDASGWRQVHRQADPLVHSISLERLAALARG